MQCRGSRHSLNHVDLTGHTSIELSSGASLEVRLCISVPAVEPHQPLQSGTLSITITLDDSINRRKALPIELKRPDSLVI